MTSPNPSALSGKTSISSHPFIWGNIAFLAGVPWLLTLSMAGLAVGDPVFPTWLEIFLLGFPAITAVVWLQWQQPFSPFSLWFLVKPSESLSEAERRVLTLVKQQRNGWYVTGWVAIAVAFVISAIFCKLYIEAPLAQAIAPFPAGLRLFGIIWAEICFLLSNVLLQSGVSALRIKLTAESEITSLQPFAVEKIRNNFTNIGWQVPQLLKFFEEALIPETVEEKDAPQETTSEQTQDVMEESQDTEISDAAEESITEASPEVVEVVESLDEDFEVNNFTEEVVSEEVETSQTESDLQEESAPELSLEISEPISEELVSEDDAIAVQEELNIAEFEVESLVEVTTEVEVNLGEDVAIEEPTQTESEVVAEFHDDTLGELTEAIVDEAPEELVNDESLDQLEATSEFNESIDESPVISDVIDNNADLSLEELPETFASQEVANNLVEEVTEASEELEINEDTLDTIETSDINEVVAESELEISEDLDSNDLIEPSAEKVAQAEFNEPEPNSILNITEDIPTSESHEVVEDTFDTSSNISDIKLDTQETANDCTEDSLDLTVNDTAAELEIDESSDSTDEEIDVNLDNPFADITEELASDNFDEDTHEEITDSSDSELEIVEPEIEAIASVTDEPNAETSEIVEESSISEITEESDHAIDLESVDVATDGSVENTEELAINEIGGFTTELSDDVSAESAIGTNLEINANLPDTQSIEDQISEETNALEINESSQESESEEIIDFVDNPVDSEIAESSESEDRQIDALIEETVDDAIKETEINNSVETDLATEAKSQKSKKSIDLFRKSRKKGFSQKNYGFGKSAKTITTKESDTDQLEASVEDDELEVTDIVAEESVESRFDIADTNLELEEIVEEPTNALISDMETDVHAELTIEQVETSENVTSDFDEELDELIAFNAYVENILQEYLGDSSEDADNETQEVEDIIEISSVSEQATEIAEEVLIAEEILETAIPESIEPPATLETTEAIAQDAQENTPESNPEYKDPKYLVQEFLVDKFLAKLEELNNADKANKTNTENTEITPEITFDSNPNKSSNPVLDEFADLEALLNRKPLSDNPE
ncbi:low-complexity tail membrane protein [Pseudanabaena yagii]|uniref:Low-complexity tail membrane protein n=1 Tax=Pseudanabaena yagii GIHE-NHR1 TaxID=2722753 RepID=A0ABX1LTC5_9CYAN|nr:low-complexity tail membrane protein [Pseudanabaena yagii]NMF59374.1 low-complexity tail membrane protein [Pseudanabaena yagii GIHE-NHR1]